LLSPSEPFASANVGHAVTGHWQHWVFGDRDLVGPIHGILLVMNAGFKFLFCDQFMGFDWDSKVAIGTIIGEN